ncbi:hypothetical protein ACRDU6_29045 [Mycolicibacterium sp. ELW1]|uniref:hypothetical protein n=1 Tax=Mycobacteriaceae TaxID=1762 RepID=UPI0011EEBE98|nr:hypothetical protein [Mycobacterium sp. ELW1]QEN16205.1 hypothetical protein D3H54_25540 [Mycobacterium sp. ELW1]
MVLTAVALKVCLAGTGVAAAVLGSHVAQADSPSFGPYAGDTIGQLQAWGYIVVLNGVGKDAGYLDEREKSACQVTGIHPTVSGPSPSGQFQSVYVDMSCPPSNNSPTD